MPVSHHYQAQIPASVPSSPPPIESKLKDHEWFKPLDLSEEFMTVSAIGRESFSVTSDHNRSRVWAIRDVSHPYPSDGPGEVVIILGPLEHGAATLFPLLFNSEYFTTSDNHRRVRVADSKLDRLEKELEAKLATAFEIDVLEDGIGHPAEEIIEDALGILGRHNGPKVLGRLATNVARPDLSSSVLRCLGRRGQDSSSWCADLIKIALMADDVEMRDAAVQAAETCGGSEARSALVGHDEPVPWLRTYVEEVIEDLAG